MNARSSWFHLVWCYIFPDLWIQYSYLGHIHVKYLLSKCPTHAVSSIFLNHPASVPAPFHVSVPCYLGPLFLFPPLSTKMKLKLSVSNTAPYSTNNQAGLTRLLIAVNLVRYQKFQPQIKQQSPSDQSVIAMIIFISSDLPYKPKKWLYTLAKDK